VNGLKEQLQAQSYMIARVGTDIKQQMDATAINKAIADSGHTRRIAASGDHHRYFAELYEKLRNQLGEFESAVGQIEQRLQQEMSAGRSPQDLGALISSQNQLFLTLSGKASELHQRVQSLLPPQHQQQQQQQQLQQKQDTAMATWTVTSL
jgi:chromosome segregation ATPase